MPQGKIDVRCSLPSPSSDTSNNVSNNVKTSTSITEGQTVKNGDVWHSKAKYKIDFNGEY